MSVQNKVKNLLWCVYTNSIPAKKNLVKRRVILEGYCDRHQSPEDIFHALWQCRVYHLSGIRIPCGTFRGPLTLLVLEIYLSMLMVKGRTLNMVIFFEHAQVNLQNPYPFTTKSKIVTSSTFSLQCQFRWGCIGVMIRVDLGLVIASLSDKVSLPTTVDKIEALAVI